MKHESLAKNEAPLAGEQRHVKIKTKPSPGAHPDTVEIGPGDEVIWDPPDDGSDFTVHFQVSPFANNDFNARDNRSGRPTDPPPHGEQRRYPYTVTIAAMVLDPMVVIRG